MRTITVTEKYRAVNEGKMAKSEFVRQMRQSYPMYVSSVSDFNSTVQILKNHNMLFEEKTEVDDSFKYSTDSLRRAIDIELEAAGLMSHEKVSGEDQEKARVKAVANLKKDPLHYYHLISGDSSKVDKHDKTVEVKKGNEVDTFNGLKKAELKEDKENLKEGTRALVGYLSGDRLTTTYNHYDGYPSGLGQGLMTHYNNDDLAKDIAMKGYITGMDPASGEISATHSDPPKKITLDDDAEERAREIAGEIDGMGADYGYIWDDESNQWITIKNTGIRSMIDQMMDKLPMMNVYSGDKMNEVPAVEEIDTSLDPLEDKKEIISQVIQLIKRSMPADNETIKSFIRTHYNDIINLGDDEAILDEFQEFLSVNTDYVDETDAYDNDEETQDMIDKMRKDGKDADDFVDEKKGTDHDKDGDIDGDDYMHAKDKAIKKAMGKDKAVKENLKAIITKVLEEDQINEAATNVLAAFGDDYAGFEGMKSAINQLENIVTDIEQYYDKTRTKIQKIYDTLGEIRNEEGLKVGGFLAPAVEQAFNRDLRPVIKMGFTKGLDQPQVKKLASPGMAQETEAPKETVFTPVNEKKK